MTDTDLPPTGYPETSAPAYGHPLYQLFAHLSNAAAAQAEEAWIPLGQREAVARRELTIAVAYLRKALHRAANAVVDLAVPDGVHPPRDDAIFIAGFGAAQSAALKALDLIEDQWLAGVVPDVDMLVPDVSDPIA